jgi:periplasmic protein TonB
MKLKLALVLLTVLMAGCATTPNRPAQVVSAGGVVYPPDARARHIEGFVQVAYDVTEDGTVANARVVESRPPGVFDEAALSAVRSWRFNAAVEHGKLVTVPLVSKVEFKLDENKAYAR